MMSLMSRRHGSGGNAEPSSGKDQKLQGSVHLIIHAHSKSNILNRSNVWFPFFLNMSPILIGTHDVTGSVPVNGPRGRVPGTPARNAACCASTTIAASTAHHPWSTIKGLQPARRSGPASRTRVVSIRTGEARLHTVALGFDLGFPTKGNDY